jgi:hypothetical protein
MYPQALAESAPNYPLADRYAFHPQHRDVIDDLG